MLLAVLCLRKVVEMAAVLMGCTPFKTEPTTHMHVSIVVTDVVLKPTTHAQTALLQVPQSNRCTTLNLMHQASPQSAAPTLMASQIPTPALPRSDQVHPAAAVRQALRPAREHQVAGPDPVLGGGHGGGHWPLAAQQAASPGRRHGRPAGSAHLLRQVHVAAGQMRVDEQPKRLPLRLTPLEPENIST